MLLALLITLQTPDIVQVTPEGFEQAKEPQVAIDGDAGIYIAYGMGDATYLSISRNGGKSYGDPIKVGEPGKLSLGMRRGPRIAARNGVITITATYGGQGRGRDGDIVAFRSQDKGATWTGPTTVNSVEGSAREGLHGMAIAPDGTVACTWLDLRQKGTALYLATSKDGGATWSENSRVYSSPSGTICECCHPSLAYDSKGKLYVMFRNSLDGARDLYLTSSADGGRTFSTAMKLGSGTWMLKGCPMDGGMLAAGPEGVGTIWRREESVFESPASGDERRISTGTQPWIAFGPGGFYRVWSQNGGVMSATPTKAGIQLAPTGNDPVIAASVGRKIAIAAWTDRGIKAVRLGP